MHALTLIYTSALIASAIANPVAPRSDEQIEPQKRICNNLRVAEGGCIRYVRGFDVTGVVTEVELNFPQVKSACDCINECLKRPTTCAAYVYKFSTPQSIQRNRRTCTLYSQFNLPSDVTIAMDVNGSKNLNVLMAGNNPQTGGRVPQTFKDINNTVPDPDAVSGEVWQLQNGQAVC